MNTWTQKYNNIILSYISLFLSRLFTAFCLESQCAVYEIVGVTTGTNLQINDISLFTIVIDFRDFFNNTSTLTPQEKKMQNKSLD